ncbi:DUF6531 domain-containing protein, partial [Variovorax sp. KK3]|uniref:DUF6531 domain-containing protein n=1 Tax=Variovorax sp. KK3 TaxID=1855728 RepID=UPI0015C3EF74
MTWSAAQAETRCMYAIDFLDFDPDLAASYVYRADFDRSDFAQTMDSFNRSSEGRCGTSWKKFVKRVGPFHVSKGAARFEVTYYDQHTRSVQLADGQCRVEDRVYTFRDLDADGNATGASEVGVCAVKLETAGSVESPEPPSCRASGISAGNPILPATQEKYESEVDIEDEGPAPLRFVRTYRSSRGNDAARGLGALGKAWSHNHEASLQWSGDTVTFASAEGPKRRFTRVGNGGWETLNSNDTLTKNGRIWTYRRAQDDTLMQFDDNGRLQSVTQRNGWRTTYRHSYWGLASIQNPFGANLLLDYDRQGRLTAVRREPGIGSVSFSYDTAGRLASVQYQDGQRRSYLYENAAFPHALTGILDESGARVSSFTYDPQGRAIVTERALGADRHQVSYVTDGQAEVVDPLGTRRSFSYATAQGQLSVTGASLPSAGSEADAASRVQDASGLSTSETDFNGIVTTTTWDTARRLPTAVTHATGTPQARTVSTQWHPTFALPVLVTEAGRTTAYVYDDKGQRLSRTVTDTSSSGGSTRTWQWTWDAQGLVATQTAPDGGVSRFEHDGLGRVSRIIDALGHVTEYRYDTYGHVSDRIEPNGQRASFTYDWRGRLLTQTVGGKLTTRVTYTATGLVETLALPSGLSFTYTYDTAHRLTGWRNNRGESGTFTLDAMGNRTNEQVKDSTGAIAWNAARTINNLNRVSSRTDGFVQPSSFGYDANGELTAETNGLNQSTRYGLDPLRRVSAITDAANATATLSYDALDSVIQAKDFKGVSTIYARDAQGNATAETSADIGQKTTRYDALGLPSQITDVLGQSTQLERDLLGRPTLITFADGKTTTLRYDLTPESRGYLSEIVDRSGKTEYVRDGFGRVITKRQTLKNGQTHQVGYVYGANGLIAGTSYPDGSMLTYQYDTTGRLVQVNRNGTPLVAAITWTPLGMPKSWSWTFASSLAANRSYDAAGRLNATEFASYSYDAAGRITSLTQKLLMPSSSNPTHASTTQLSMTSFVGYDAVGRIVSFSSPGNQTAFSYDANGNRTASTKTSNGQTTSRGYALAGSSNRIEGFSQTTGGTTTNVTYGYNANGDMTSDGLRTYAYDAEGRLSAVTTGATDTSPTTRYA